MSGISFGDLLGPTRGKAVLSAIISSIMFYALYLDAGHRFLAVSFLTAPVLGSALGFSISYFFSKFVDSYRFDMDLLRKCENGSKEKRSLLIEILVRNVFFVLATGILVYRFASVYQDMEVKFPLPAVFLAMFLSFFSLLLVCRTVLWAMSSVDRALGRVFRRL